jgi:hypothetical protein
VMGVAMLSHRRRLQPDRREADAAVWPAPDHRVLALAGSSDTDRRDRRLPCRAGAWATRCSSPPRWPRS